MPRSIRLLEKYKALPVQVKASGWFMFCSVMQRGISVLTTPIFTRLLTTGDYGAYGVFNSWLDIVSIFVTLRLYYGVFVQGLVKFENDQKKYASSMQGLLLTLCSIWTVVYLVFKDFWNSLLGLTTVQMLAMLLMIWSVGAYRFWAAEQRNRFIYRPQVILTIIITVLKPLASILLVINANDKATARILGIALVEVLGYTWTFFFQLSRGKAFYSAKYWKHALLFNLPLLPHYLSQTVLNSADRIMIRNMVGESAAGIYTLAYSLSKLMTMFTTAVNQTLSPWMYQKIKAGRAKDIERIAYPVLICIGCVTLIMIALAPEIMAVFAPRSYHEAILVIPPVALSVLFMFSYQLFATFEFYFEKTKFIMVASVAGALLNIVLNHIFITRFGYIAAGYTTLFCYMLYCLGHYCFMKRIFKENMNNAQVYNGRILLGIFGLFILLGLMLLFTYKNRWIRYAMILCMVGIIIWKRGIILNTIRTILRSRKSKTLGRSK